MASSGRARAKERGDIGSGDTPRTAIAWQLCRRSDVAVQRPGGRSVPIQPVRQCGTRARNELLSPPAVGYCVKRLRVPVAGSCARPAGEPGTMEQRLHPVVTNTSRIQFGLEGGFIAKGSVWSATRLRIGGVRSGAGLARRGSSFEIGCGDMGNAPVFIADGEGHP